MSKPIFRSGQILIIKALKGKAANKAEVLYVDGIHGYLLKWLGSGVKAYYPFNIIEQSMVIYEEPNLGNPNYIFKQRVRK